MMTTDERVKLSKGKTEKVIDALRTLLQVRMSNELILYSGLLSKQVGKSYAAHSFNVLKGSLFESEVVRVCALWDCAVTERQARSRDSIPAIAWLLNSNEVLEALRAEHIQSHLQLYANPAQGPDDPAMQVAAVQQNRMAENEGRKAMDALTSARDKIVEIEKSDLHVALRTFRNNHVAHALDVTSLEAKVEVAEAKYGQERELFDKTIDLMNGLYFGVCNASYAWDMAREHSQRYANALLSKCQLNIVE